MWRETVHSQSYTTFFRHSAVLSLPAVLLRELASDVRCPVVSSRERRENMTTKIQFCLLISEALVPIFNCKLNTERFARVLFIFVSYCVRQNA